MTTERIITRMSPSKLRNHPLNQEIYADKPDAEFLDLTKDGIEEPIVCTPGFVSISGHRRMQAARIHKHKDVPVIIRNDCDDPDYVEWLLVISNRHRVKTNEQLAREVQHLHAIAERRTKKGRPPEKPQVTTETDVADKGATDGTFNSPPGRVVEQVAGQLGIGKETARKAKKVVDEIDAAEAKGHTKKAAKIRDALNTQGVGPAHDVATGKKKKSPKKKAAKNPTDAAFDKAEQVFGQWVRASKELLKEIGAEGHQHSILKAKNDEIQKALKSWRKESHRNDQEQAA